MTPVGKSLDSQLFHRPGIVERVAELITCGRLRHYQDRIQDLAVFNLISA